MERRAAELEFASGMSSGQAEAAAWLELARKGHCAAAAHWIKSARAYAAAGHGDMARRAGARSADHLACMGVPALASLPLAVRAALGAPWAGTSSHPADEMLRPTFRLHEVVARIRSRRK